MESKNPPAVRVLYIMGFGRSGSTILDTVLGNHQNIESVGELRKLPILGWLENGFCACGQRADNCSFWQSVKNQWLQTTGLKNIQEYVNLQNNIDQLWRPYRKFQAPNILSTDFKTYATYTTALYQAISNVSGKQLIVDSSKNLLQAYVLSFMEDIDLKVIHLFRDARGVAWSKKKSFKKEEDKGIITGIKPMSIWRSAINWNRINLRSDWVRNQIDPVNSIRISYEDFVRNPKIVLTKIGRLIDEDFNNVITKLEQESDLYIGHTIAGNRVRMAGSIKLRLDEEWRKNLSLPERSLIWLISGPLMNKYKSTKQNLSVG